MIFVLPDHVKFIMNKVISESHEIYLVGGTVRDYLLDLKTDDFDFASSALPSQIKDIFEGFKILDYGEEHGTVSIYYQGKLYEITTFREEGEYTDGRRPDEVKFVSDLKSDLARRDFTINAMAVSIEGELIDYFNGLDDFKNGIIRAVGDPTDRINEDSLRILRAIRFSLRLNFEIENKTKNAIKELAKLLKTHAISGERILSELKEIFMFSNQCFDILDELNILEVLFPRIYELKYSKELIQYSIKLKNDAILSWSLLLYFESDKGKNCEEICLEVFENYPGLSKINQLIVFRLVESLDYTISLINTFTVRRILRWMKSVVGQLPKQPEFDPSDFYDKLINFSSIFNHNLDNLKSVKLIIEKNIHLFPIQLPIDGYDIKNMGFQGRVIGDVLNECKRYYLNNHPLNKTKLIDHVKNLLDTNEIHLKIIRGYVSDDEPLFLFDEDNEINQCLMERISILSQKFDRIILIGSKKELKPINFSNKFFNDFKFELEGNNIVEKLEIENISNKGTTKITLLSKQTEQSTK